MSARSDSATQLLSQLGFIHDAVKSVHFVNFTTSSCNSYYNKLVLFKDFNTQSLRLFSILDKEQTRRTSGLIFHSLLIGESQTPKAIPPNLVSLVLAIQCHSCILNARKTFRHLEILSLIFYSNFLVSL